MISDEKLRYCPNCLGKDIVSNDGFLYNGKKCRLQYFTLYKGFITDEYKESTCPTCNGEIISMNLNITDWEILNYISLEQDFLFAMDKLKQDNIIEFTTKMAEYNETAKRIKTERLNVQKKYVEANTPKCPTCGSTNIKRISATKRFVGTGLFGLASSTIGKNQECLDCGAKW